jgi:hypothetical protein
MSKKRQYQIVNSSLNPVREIDIDGHTVALDAQGQGMVYDTGLAEEVDARYGYKSGEETAGKVVCIPVDDSDPTREAGHTYTFLAPDLSRFKGKQP